MERLIILDILGSLAQLDIDAAIAYTRTNDEINIQFVRHTFEECRGDQEMHYNSLIRIIRRLGGRPSEPPIDFKGLGNPKFYRYSS